MQPSPPTASTAIPGMRISSYRNSARRAIGLKSGKLKCDEGGSKRRHVGADHTAGSNSSARRTVSGSRAMTVR